jgi:hypothetical protein
MTARGLLICGCLLALALAGCGSSGSKSSSAATSGAASQSSRSVSPASDPIDAVHSCLVSAGYSQFHFAGPASDRNTVTVTTPSSVVQVILTSDAATASQEAVTDGQGGRAYAKAQGKILVFADAAPVPSAADQTKIEHCAFSVPAAAAASVTPVQSRTTAVLSCLTQQRFDATVEDTPVQGTPTDGKQIMLFAPTGSVSIYPSAADAAKALAVESSIDTPGGGSAKQYGTVVIGFLRATPAKTQARVAACTQAGG